MFITSGSAIGARIGASAARAGAIVGRGSRRLLSRAKGSPKRAAQSKGLQLESPLEKQAARSRDLHKEWYGEDWLEKKRFGGDRDPSRPPKGFESGTTSPNRPYSLERVKPYRGRVAAGKAYKRPPKKERKAGKSSEWEWATPGSRHGGKHPSSRVGERRVPLERKEQLDEILPQRIQKDIFDKVRDEARRIYHGKYPDSVGLDVHHRFPLEHAHLFPTENPNRLDNLVGLRQSVHKKINNEWTSFAQKHKSLGKSPTAKQVADKVAEIDKKHGKFYHKK